MKYSKITSKCLRAVVALGVALGCLSLSTSISNAAPTVSTFYSGTGLANFPNQSVVDPAGNLWIVGNDNPDTYLTKISSTGAGTIIWEKSTVPLPGTSCTDTRNYGVAYYNGRIYWTANCGAVYSVSSSLTTTATTSDIQLNVNRIGLNNFCGIAITPSGVIYLDNWGNELYKFQTGATPEFSEVSSTFNSDPNATAWAMSIGPDGNLYFGGGTTIWKLTSGSTTPTVYYSNSIWSLSSFVFLNNGSGDLVTVDWSQTVGLNVIEPDGSGGGRLTSDSPLLTSQSLINSASGISIDSNGNLFITISNAGTIHSITKVSGLTFPTPTTTTTTTVLPILYSKPTAPSNVIASLSDGTATVSFTPGDSGNLSTYDEIDMFNDGQPAGDVCNVSLINSCSITNLGPDTIFAFTVTAINSLGSAASSPSNQVSYASPTTSTTITTLPPTTITTTAVTKHTISCVKGTVVKRVTAVNPVCPVGYKKK
jgi:hypothetical protein